jgi:hypothetical protein
MIEVTAGTENAASTHDQESGWNVLLGISTRFESGDDPERQFILAQFRTRMAVTPEGEIPFLDLSFIPFELRHNAEEREISQSFTALPVSLLRDVRIGNDYIATIDAVGYRLEGRAQFGPKTQLLFQSAVETLGAVIQDSPFQSAVATQIRAARQAYVTQLENSTGGAEITHPYSGDSLNAGWHLGTLKSQISLLIRNLASTVGVRMIVGGQIGLNFDTGGFGFATPNLDRPSYHFIKLEVGTWQSVRNAFTELRVLLGSHVDVFTRFDLYQIANRTHVRSDHSGGSAAGEPSQYFNAPHPERNTQVQFTFGAAAHF